MPGPFDDLVNRIGQPCTLFDESGESAVRRVRVVYSNSSSLSMLGSSRADLIGAYVQSTVAVSAGQVLGSPVHPRPDRWYLIVKTLLHSRAIALQPATSLVLVALPYLLDGVRVPSVPAPSTLNAYGEPSAVDSGGHPVAGARAMTLRCGFSNTYDPLALREEGPEPGGITTLYAPPRADVRLGDQLSLPDGRPISVAQTNALYADGLQYALQVIANDSAGSGLQAGV